MLYLLLFFLTVSQAVFAIDIQESCPLERPYSEKSIFDLIAETFTVRRTTFSCSETDITEFSLQILRTLKRDGKTIALTEGIESMENNPYLYFFIDEKLLNILGKNNRLLISLFRCSQGDNNSGCPEELYKDINVPFNFESSEILEVKSFPISLPTSHRLFTITFHKAQMLGSKKYTWKLGLFCGVENKQPVLEKIGHISKTVRRLNNELFPVETCSVNVKNELLEKECKDISPEHEQQYKKCEDYVWHVVNFFIENGASYDVPIFLYEAQEITSIGFLNHLISGSSPP